MPAGGCNVKAGLNVISALLPLLSFCPLPFSANRVLSPGHSVFALHTHSLADPCMTKPKFMVEAPDSYLEAA